MKYDRKKPWGKIPLSTRLQVAVLWKEGLTVKQIGEALSITGANVLYYAEKYGVRSRAARVLRAGRENARETVRELSGTGSIVAPNKSQSLRAD